MIRLAVNDLIEKKNKFDNETINELTIIRNHAQKILNIREELINTKDEKFLYSKHELIDFSSIENDILNYRSVVNNQKIELEINNFENLPNIYANYQILMEGVFFELIDNAIKAMPNGGKISISGRKESGQLVKILVTDNGCGIKKDIKNEIFNSSFSEWANLDTQSTGQGLFYMNTIIEYYNGNIEVSSKESKGTTFTIIFPIYSKTENDLEEL